MAGSMVAKELASKLDEAEVVSGERRAKLAACSERLSHAKAEFESAEAELGAAEVIRTGLLQRLVDLAVGAVVTDEDEKLSSRVESAIQRLRQGRVPARQSVLAILYYFPSGLSSADCLRYLQRMPHLGRVAAKAQIRQSLSNLYKKEPFFLEKANVRGGKYKISQGKIAEVQEELGDLVEDVA